jgi:PTH2 family peptidyl-tRNA hydrolase
MTEEKFAKQVLVVRKDLKMSKGKLAAQCSHASLGCILKRMPSQDCQYGVMRTIIIEHDSAMDAWINGIFTKVCLGVQTEEELLEIYKKAQEFSHIPSVLITDAGKTVFNGVETNTVVGIGPGWSDEIDMITGDLKLL